MYIYIYIYLSIYLSIYIYIYIYIPLDCPRNAAPIQNLISTLFGAAASPNL